MIHLAVFSVGTPTASARTSAAAAEGASPMTEPGPWAASQAARTPAMVVDLPVPAAPTIRSSRRPEVTTADTAAACSAESTFRPAATASAGSGSAGMGAVGASVAAAASRRRASASRSSWVA